MVNYSNGKIYKIEPLVEHDEGDIYIGATTKQYLSQRMDTHRRDYNRFQNGKYHYITVYQLFEKYGVENCKITLLENCNNITTKDELNSRETHYIQTLKCVNKMCKNPERRIGKICICICGTEYRSEHEKRHQRTEEHIKYVKDIETQSIESRSKFCTEKLTTTENPKDKIKLDDIYDEYKTNNKFSCITLIQFSKYIKEKYKDHWNHDVRIGTTRGGFVKMKLKK